MTRRSKLEIILNVLEVIHSGESKPTRIMYQSNLSYTLLKNVLDDLVHQELISEIDQTLNKRKRDKRTNKMYEITSKGQNVLRYFNNAKGLLQIEDSNLRPYQVSN